MEVEGPALALLVLQMAIVDLLAGALAMEAVMAAGGVRQNFVAIFVKDTFLLTKCKLH